MSGGKFNYAYSRVNTFAEELEQKIIDRFEVDQWGDTPNYYSDPVINRMREIVIEAKKFATVMRAVEWIYSGDISEETFLNRSEESHSPPGTAS